MSETRETLLVRLRDARDDRAWEEFFALYAPLILRFAQSRGLSGADAEEVRDHCLEIVVREMSSFDYQRERGGFRGWLYTMTHARVVDAMRRRQHRGARLDTEDLQAVADPDPHADPAAAWDACWRQNHLAYAMEQARWLVSAQSYRAFELLLLEDCTVPDVCAKLRINRNQVYKARQRVLDAVRSTLARLGEEGLAPRD